MKGIVLDAFAGPETLRLAEVAPPELRPTNVLVRVRAVGVNRADILQRQGAYAGQVFGDNPLLGLELAGEVVEFGAEVTRFRPSDWLMAIAGGGAYARGRADRRACAASLRARRAPPLVARRFLLAEARAAHEALEAGGRLGKIVLTVDRPSRARPGPGAGAAPIVAQAPGLAAKLRQSRRHWKGASGPRRRGCHPAVGDARPSPGRRRAVGDRRVGEGQASPRRRAGSEKSVQNHFIRPSGWRAAWASNSARAMVRTWTSSGPS